MLSKACCTFASRAVRQAGNDRSSGKYFRITGQHDGCHRASRRQPRDEHAAPVDPVIDDGFFDHLPDRVRFAPVAPAVFGLKPVEAAVGIVGALLLRQQQREAVTLGKRRPPCAEIIPGCGLGTAVQHDNEGRIFRKRGRHIGHHPQVAWVRSEAANFAQPCQLAGRDRLAVQALNQFLPSGPALAQAQARHCVSKIHRMPRWYTPTPQMVAAVHKYQGQQPLT